ncbi:MAG: hypothetical protein KDD42_00370 [Bdellovibrionales bacterium]|nr:hypothetical protein [Bdellovibrionales bacterium]
MSVAVTTQNTELPNDGEALIGMLISEGMCSTDYGSRSGDIMEALDQQIRKELAQALDPAAANSKTLDNLHKLALDGPSEVQMREASKHSDGSIDPSTYPATRMNALCIVKDHLEEKDYHMAAKSLAENYPSDPEINNRMYEGISLKLMSLVEKDRRDGVALANALLSIEGEAGEAVKVALVDRLNSRNIHYLLSSEPALLKSSAHRNPELQKLINRKLKFSTDK